MHLTTHTGVHLGGSCGLAEGCDLVDEVIPNLANPSAIVTGNAPSHWKVDKPLTKLSLKKINFGMFVTSQSVMQIRHEEINFFSH
jgi:hypothetical protein